MFPPALSTSTGPVALLPGGLRARLVRGLDLAVEFATLGEYGVEEVRRGPAGAPAGALGHSPAEQASLPASLAATPAGIPPRRRRGGCGGLA